MNFLDKLDMMMGKYGLNKHSLASMSGIPYTTIDTWYKKGYENARLSTIRKLSDYFNTSLDFWMVDEISDVNHGKEVSLSPQESEILSLFRQLDETDRAVAKGFLQGLLENEKYKEKVTTRKTV